MRTRATFRSRASSKKLARRAATLSILSLAAALVVTNLTPVVVTSASWTDEEWDHGKVSTLSCADDGSGSDFKTRGAGRLLGGEVLATDLDSIVALKGMTVTNDGGNPHPAPDVEATSPNTYQNPLDVSALNSIELPVVEGVTDRFLNSLLTLTADPGPGDNIGAVNQYAHASDTGVSQGASGVGNDSGVILNGESGGLPGLGTIKLSTLVQNLTGQAISDVVAGITDLELEIGAVASRTTLDACEAAWTGDIDSNLTREYAIAGLDASMHAPVVEGVSSALADLLRDVQTSLDLIAGKEGVISGITGVVGPLLGVVLGDALSLRTPPITGPTITIDPHALDRLATASISDKNDVVVLDLATGRVQVNFAALLGEVYSGKGFNGVSGVGLNSLPPNTELIVNNDVTTALATALRDALGGWTADVLATAEAAIDAVRVKTTISVVLSASILGFQRDVADVTIDVDGTLEELLADKGVSASVDLRLTGIGLVDELITQLVGGVSSTIVTTLNSGVGSLVAGILNMAIGDSGLVAGLTPEVAKITASVVATLSNVLVGILGDEDGLVSLRVNVQNDPAAPDDPDAGPPLTYPEWDDPDSSRMIPDDQYDVAALSVSVSVSLLDIADTAGNINLELARSSVGANCWVKDDERCFAY